MIDRDVIKKHANLPVKLAELSRVNEAAALKLLRDWGEGRKTIDKLWEEIQRELNY